MSEENMFAKRPDETRAEQVGRVGLGLGVILSAIFFGGKLLRDALTWTDDGELGSGLTSTLTWIFGGLAAFTFLALKWPEMGRWWNDSAWPWLGKQMRGLGSALGDAVNYVGEQTGLIKASYREGEAIVAEEQPAVYRPDAETPGSQHDIADEQLGDLSPPGRLQGLTPTREIVA